MGTAADTTPTPSFAAFAGHTLIHRGELVAVALAARARLDDADDQRVVLYDERTGAVLDLDLGVSEPELIARLTPTAPPEPRRGRGRPRLGVVAREVTLLPRHWDWLRSQRGGASATLRRLVDQARRANAAEDVARRAIDVTHKFLWDIAGDLPGFEEATRALFAGDFESFDDRTDDWPPDVREQTVRLSAPARAERPEA